MDIEEANAAPLPFPLLAVFAYPDAGHEVEWKRAAEMLVPGRVYRVASLTAGRPGAWLELHELRGLRWSAALFAPYWDRPEQGGPELGLRVAVDPGAVR